MSSKSTSIKDVEEIAEQAHSGVDVSEHFSGQYQAKQRVDVALSLEQLRGIDADCRSRNISRQEWINQACTERLRAMKRD